MYNLIIYLAAALVGGIGIGYVTRNYVTKKSVRDLEQKQKELILKAKDEAFKIKEEAKSEEEKKRKYLEEIERDLRRKEETLDRRFESIDAERNKIVEKEKEIREIKTEIIKIKDEQQETLLKVAKMKKEEAKDLLLQMVEKEYKDDLIAKIKSEKQKAKQEADIYAREILSTVIERMAAEHAAETTVASVSLPSDEMKGRIIGREGRNIQIFEKVTGVDVLIDD